LNGAEKAIPLGVTFRDPICDGSKVVAMPPMVT